MSSFRSKIGQKLCRNQSKSIKFLIFVALPDFCCSFKFSNKKKTFHLHFNIFEESKMHFNIFEESKMRHILTSNSTHYPIISGYVVLEEHYTMYVVNILSDNFRIG